MDDSPHSTPGSNGGATNGAHRSDPPRSGALRSGAPRSGAADGPIPVRNASIGDDALIRAVHQGDYAALGELFQRHQKALYGFLRARLFDASEADDLCQEVFLRCCKAQATFESPEQVRSWLIGIARNVLREYIRRQQRRREVGWTKLCLAADESSPPAESAFEDVAAHLPDCMENLGQNARDALEMHYRSRLRLAQIGQRLKRSEGAVKLLMYRARQALKDCLSSKTNCGLSDDE